MKSPIKVFANKSLAFRMRLARGVCGFLVVLSLGGLLFDYFWLRDVTCAVEALESPSIHRGDPYQMQQLEKKIQRLGWGHSDTFLVLQFGNEHWMKLIMPYVERRDYLDCAGDHKDSAMSYITCHAPPQRILQEGPELNGAARAAFADQHATYWLKWWRENQDRKQWEWVQSGLAEWGLAVERPITVENGRAILLALGRQRLFSQQQNAIRSQVKKNTDVKAATSPELLEPQISREQVLPDFVLYNAARWLRDFGGLQALAERPTSSGSEEEERLLLRLGIVALEARWERNANARLGLDDAHQDPDGSYDWQDWKSHPFVQTERILVPAALITLLVSTCCMAWVNGYLRGQQKVSVVPG